MKRTSIVVTTLVCFTFQSVFFPAAIAHDHPPGHGGGGKQKGQATATNCPGTDANGNAVAGDGTVEAKGVLAANGKFRVKLKGNTTNESGVKQKYKDEPEWEFLILAILALMFGEDEEEFDDAIIRILVAVAAKGNVRGKAAGQLQ